MSTKKSVFTDDPRHIARRVALATLFSWGFLSQNLDECQQYAESVIEAKDYDIDLAKFLIKGVTENIDTLDGFVGYVAREYPVEQMAKVDLIATRIALFEVMIAKNSPLKVAVDEAVLLAKEFGGDGSGKFVNGVLGSIAKLLNLG
ncbi:transcription antitermination factor NusB [candidate division WWE3 bacterium CG08_land_8_20_14_0_20_40_13]|uniref:Transcription antitermination protein NusB n=1 Tax=candidate division WWE3 bacterium CG08_land_8_20_14_0_20_40_13 TaxID=1975084 RepID=A0A2H0XDN8_UNCKA|nr:MAG: transcription antitermination factor NusB [candidate division WWE3 bacterium CG08_land_8_20_14_0_20_40_13]